MRAADNASSGQAKPRAHLASVIWGLPLFALGFWGAAISAPLATAYGIYFGFAAALLLWGWVELAFLSGVLTGPNRAASPPNLPLRPRLMRAFWAIAWHEGALLALMMGLLVLQIGSVNPITAATFALLLGARSLAKINLFLGVPRINLHFIPRPIGHMISHFRQGPATGFLPLSIGLLALATALLGLRAAQSTTAEAALFHTILSTLAALALLEHLFMVLPLPDAKLWSWMLPKPKHTIKTLEDPHGL